MKTVTLIHATPAAMAPISRAMERLAGVRALNLLDEALLSEVQRRGSVDLDCKERMATDISLAIQADSQAVLITCNAYSSVIPELRERFSPFPVLSVDEPMVEKALQTAHYIAVIGTVESGLREQIDFIRRTAEARGREIELTSILCDGAFSALLGGNPELHDQLLLEELAKIGDPIELILLAQASMARLLDCLSPNQNPPVWASPDLAVAELASLLDLAI